MPLGGVSYQLEGMLKPLAVGVFGAAPAFLWNTQLLLAPSGPSIPEAAVTVAADQVPIGIVSVVVLALAVACLTHR